MPQNTKSISEARKRATNKYLQEKVDEIKVRVPKGQKEAVQTHAAACGESVNGFIGRAIKEAIARDGVEKPAGTPGTPAAIPISPAQQNAAQPVSAPVLAPEQQQQVKAHIEKTGEKEAAFLERAVSATIKRDGVSLEMGINPATGEKLQQAGTHAEARREPISGFLARAIDETIERDQNAPAASQGDSGVAEQ